MCVLALAWRAHPRWQLLVAGNRDELHARPAAPLARWDQPDQVIAGRDLPSNGTWLGVSELGRFVVVTNLRGHGHAGADRVSRGSLVTGLLSSAGRHADPSDADLSAFNPFNLIAADGDRCEFLSNQPAPVRCMLASGIYGLSNGALDEPWPKTMLLKSRLLRWIMNGEAPLEILLHDLRDDTLPEVGIRPTVASDVPEEPRLSPIFIRHPVYGTRCSTIVAVDARGQGTIIERRYSPAGDVTGETTLGFSWPA